MRTNPTLKSLLIRDFRSISGEWTIPLDAGIVLVHGPNGAGKTSILSALELASTGKISYLDRLGDDSYLTYLNHRGSTSGLVTLEAVGFEERNAGGARLTAKGAECAPLLDGQLAQVFVERCFLPQATLGRLFEVYAPKQARGAVTPLMRFVKEILGLDAVDSLIDGLQATRHISRVEKLSRHWDTVERRLEALRNRQRTATAAQGAAAARVKELRTTLLQHLEIGDENVEDKVLVQAIASLNESGARHAEELAQLKEALLRLDAIESTLQREDLLSADPHEPEGLFEITTAEARLVEWRSSRSGPLFEWFATTLGEEAVEAEADPSTALRKLKSQIAELNLTVAEARRRLATLDDLIRRFEELQLELADTERRLATLNLQISDTSSSSAASELASLLVAVLGHIDGEECPVCGQQFEQPRSLRQHVLSRVDSLNQDAVQLLQMEQSRTVLTRQRSALAAQLGDTEAQIMGLQRTVIEGEIHDATVQLAVLRSLEPIGEAGRVAVDDVMRLRALQASSVRKQTLLEECLTDLSVVARLLQTEAPSGLVMQRVAALKAFAQARTDEHELDHRRLLNVNGLREELLAALNNLDVEETTISEIAESISVLTRQIEEAKRRKEVASDLRKDAERMRTAITSQVFDEQLNGAWAKIFSALVPSEPFIPQFRALPVGSRQASVEIETVHRDGVQAASPAAMLSHGNLNTAALSLFVALHFAVSSRLPWLVFDDPVQSMDELHVANFASMVKQLTRQNGRQVIIAVHERELFEYLSLELTPASQGEEVLTVELERTYGRSVITWDRLQFHEDNALTPISAA